MEKKSPRQYRKQRARLRKQLRADLQAAKGCIEDADFHSASRLVAGVLEQSPDDAAAHQLAASVAFRLGDLGRAQFHLEVAVENDSGNTAYLFDLAMTYARLGQTKREITTYQKIISLQPRSAVAYANLGFIYRRYGEFGKALAAFAKAVEFDPEHVGAQHGWIQLLGRIQTPEFEPEIAEALVGAFDSPHSYHPNLAPATAAQLKLKYGFGQGGPEGDQLPDPDDPLLLRYLTRCVNIDLELEAEFTRLRKLLLLSEWGDERKNSKKMAMLLARQAYINEFVFYASEGERKKVESLRLWIEARLLENELLIEDETEDALLCFAMYEPFSLLQGGRVLEGFSDEELGSNLIDLVQLVLRDAREEKAVDKEITTLKPIVDNTSRAVQKQYEENPYPRWLHLPRQIERQPGPWLAEMFPDISPPSFLKDDMKILIAGCGTGQHAAAVALEFPRAYITAIDLSRASLCYAVRMAKKLGIANIHFQHADILDAGLLDGTFDMIQSIGVLHHMYRPLDGWRVLSGLLREGGVFKAGLYAERGRRGVMKCREIIAREGIGSTRQDIVDFRRRLIAEPQAPGFSGFMKRVDFFSTSMCRDLLFHVQEVCYTPKRLKVELDAVGLEFIGFENLEGTGMAEAYRQAFPGQLGMSNLGNWEVLEAGQENPPEGYMFWCHKPGA